LLRKYFKTNSRKKNTAKNKNPLETKNDILEAAINVFVEKGVVRSTLEQIAAKAGFTRGAVYWHFKIKMIFCRIT